MNQRSIGQENLAEMNRHYRTALINSLSGYKSPHLVGTRNKDGVENLAIFSNVFHLGADPALMGMIARPLATEFGNHTLKNIEQTGFFTLNQVQEAMIVQAHQTSARYPDEVSEFASCGFNSVYLEDFPAPFVEASFLKIGLELAEIKPISLNGTYLIIGAVKKIILPEQFLLEDGSIDFATMQSVAVTGLDRYHQVTFIEQLPYAKV